MPRAREFDAHREQSWRESRRHYTADKLGRTCVICDQRMVKALDVEPYNCHPACDPCLGR